MKKPAANGPVAAESKTASAPEASRKGKIHPVVIYPFQRPNHYHDLEELYQLVARLDGQHGRFARPITVMDRKTFFRSAPDKQFQDFRKNLVAKHSHIIDAWCVDTCQMWYTGLGAALEKGAPGDVYWLIPGDFNYGSPVGKEVLGRLHDLPEIILELQQDLCVGEIMRDHCDSKQLIDTYGTFALLLNWFPGEAQEIRRLCACPRSEFIALRHEFLHEVLNLRWYAYEQTLVILLHALFTKHQVSRFSVGDISDLPQGKESLAAAVQQVERLERVLKMLWRERNQQQAGWFEQYRALEEQSEQIRNTANIILQRLLQ